jgi:hypothetical protein
MLRGDLLSSIEVFIDYGHKLAIVSLTIDASVMPAHAPGAYDGHT